MLLLIVEFGLSLLAIVMAFVTPRLGDRWFSAIEHCVGKFAARRRLAVFTILFLALGARLAVLPIEPIPHPGVHDEFSHLLIGDTLAHGRLANPTPPMWEHFETFHENFIPAYASMYYPGQGVFLALGQVVFGHPFWGVWLSTGLMCGAICWALQGWLTPGWALLGALVAVIRLGMFSYWVDSYWGGSVAAIGGALVIGALPRIAESQRGRDAVLMALGFAILANTRPFESLFFCIPIGAGLLAFLFLKVRPRSRWIRTVLLPTAAVLTITIGLMMLYFYRTTGHPFTIPYKVNMQRYGYVYFPWQKFNSNLHFNHEAMRVFYERELPDTAMRWRKNSLEVTLFRCFNLWSFFLNSALMIPLLFLVFALPVNLRIEDLDWQTRFLLIGCAFSVVALFLPTLYLSPHYAAPLTCAFYILYLNALQRVGSWSPGRRPVGRMLVRAVPVVCLILALTYIVDPAWRRLNGLAISTWYTHWEPLDRTGIEETLQSAPGQQLVIVRYGPQHESVNEWVFNGAGIQGAKIVWARDMGPEKNQELINLHPSRRVWLLEPDYTPPRLTAYSAEGLKQPAVSQPGLH